MNNILKINKDEINDYFVSSDHHYGHYNVIKYCNRPFNYIQEMEYNLTKNWNDTLSTKSNLIYNGDFLMNPKYYKILLELNFNKIYFILGNHDNKNKLQKLIDEYNLNIEIFKNLTIEFDNKQYFFTHFPYNCSDLVPSIIGHVHYKYKKLNIGDTINGYLRSEKRDIVKILKQPILNVGIDVWDYYPVSLKECINILNN